ncbi:MAG: sialate O-acetylesterase [Phycisphaerae bacterium]
MGIRMRSLAALLGFAVAAGAHADVTPASLFTDHAVLLQNASVPVWGTADAGEQVKVTIAGQTQTATAGADGKWMVHLADLKAGGPYELTIEGKNTVTLHDVLVGEVWLCSGQSNMDFTVARTPKYRFAGTQNEAAEVAAANYPEIRMFSGEWTKSYTPQSRIAGTWKVCNPENVREFSAIGYFFARDLQKELKVPVGIVTMTYGASTAQAWIRREKLMSDPETAPLIEAFDAAVEKFKAAPPPASEPAAAGSKAQRARGGPKDPVQNQHNPTVMYNGMIAPAVPYGIRGVLWYQGESITGDKKQFPKLNAMLIEDWRKLWNAPELPFYFCQLAALKASSNSPEVREMQAEALKIPHTAMAVTIDIGDAKSVHPKDKQDVGDRLTRIALANVYGKQIEYSGPVYEGMSVEGDAVRVKFTHAEGLTGKGGELKTFEVAGADGKFVPAYAKVEGETVVVSSPEVTSPAAVRYAWANYPEGCNLYNAAGLPAAPFRTDKQ